jgi:hypothetical protein
MKESMYYILMRTELLPPLPTQRYRFFCTAFFILNRQEKRPTDQMDAPYGSPCVFRVALDIHLPFWLKLRNNV